jgi:hypothetical protein
VSNNDWQVHEANLCRNVFRGDNLVYLAQNGHWLKSRSCVEHTSMAVGSHVSIAADHSHPQEIFVNFLSDKTVTPAFVMGELATAEHSCEDG